MAKLDFEKLNKMQRYSQHAVFKVVPGALGAERGEIVEEARRFFAGLEEAGKVVVRGIYDLSGMRDSADFMIWWHAEQFEDCLLYTSPSPRDVEESRMPSSA